MKPDTRHDKSMFLKEMEEFARELGTDVHDLLVQYRESVRSAEYPGPDCLEPYEIERYVYEGALPSERQKHVLACSWCGTAVEAARPSTDLKERFAAAVRGATGEMAPSVRLAAEAPVLATASEGTTSHRWQPALFARAPLASSAAAAFEILGDALSATVPTVIALVLLSSSMFYAFLGAHAQLTPWLFVPAGILLLAVAAVPALVPKWRFLTHVTGAVVGGLAIAGMVTFYIIQEKRDKLDLSLALAQEQLQEVAVRSLENQARYGSFITVNSNERPVRLATPSLSRAEVTYGATAPGLPGRLVAEIRPDSGRLWWEYANSRTLRARFLVGTVKATDVNGFLLESAPGNTVKVAYSGGLRELETRGPVFAVLDPQSNTAIKTIPMRVPD